MMGGGMLFRTVARAVGSPGPNPVVSSQVASTTAACSACSGQLSRPNSALRTSCTHSTLSKQNGDHNMDDWEFAGHDDGTDGRPLERFVFGPPPSRNGEPEECTAISDQCWHIFGLPPSLDEATQAASELQLALAASSSLEAAEQQDSDTASSTTSVTVDYSNSSSYVDSQPPLAARNAGTTRHLDSSLEWTEPQLYMSESGVIQVTKNPVYEAFQLLQNDPNVKGAVISIVSDPDVWRAMMKNEKVQELKRIFEGPQGLASVVHEAGESVLPSSQIDDNKRDFDFVSSISDMVHLILVESRQALLHMKFNISTLVRSMMALLSNNDAPMKQLHTEGDADPFHNAVRSSLMLAVVILAIVLVKRVQA